MDQRRPRILVILIEDEGGIWGARCQGVGKWASWERLKVLKAIPVEVVENIQQ